MIPPPASAELLAVVRAARALLPALDADRAEDRLAAREREALCTALEALDRIA